MFKFLKEKLGGVLKKIGKKVEEESPVEVVEEKKEVLVKEKKRNGKKERVGRKERVAPRVSEVVEELRVEVKGEGKPVGPEVPVGLGEEKGKVGEEEKKGFFSRLFKRKEEEKPPVEEKRPKFVGERVEVPVVEKAVGEKTEERRGFFASVKERIVTTRISSEKFRWLFGDLELVLLENNVAVEVVDKIREDLEKKLVDQPIRRGRVEFEIKKVLRRSIEDVLGVEQLDVVRMVREKVEKPFVMVFVGINGSGKTTSIAKVAHLLKEEGFSVVLAAGDTWRAASAEQLEEWGRRLGVKVIKHEYGSDPAAVAFDAVKFAKAHSVDVVLVDTAGRQQSNVNLMREMEKIVRVAKPDVKVFVGESITGNDVVNQAREFDRYVKLDGVILTKADVDEKGGAVLSVGYVTKKPILYLGVGQLVSDLRRFDKEEIVGRLGL